MTWCILASFAVAPRCAPLAPSIVFGCFAHHRDGVVDCSRASRARVSARASRAIAHLLRGSSSQRRWSVASSRHSRLHLGVCLWHRRSSVASLVIATGWWIARAPFALTCGVAPPAPPHVSLVTRRRDGDDSLRSRAVSGCISACASGTVDLRSLRLSSRRCGRLLARQSRPRVGSRNPRRCASLAWLVVTMAMVHCILAPFPGASRRVPQVPPVFACVVHRHDGIPYHSRFSRACVSLPRASYAIALPSRCSSPRRALLAFRVSRVSISACASGAVGFRLRRSSSRRRPNHSSASRAVNLPSPRSSPPRVAWFRVSHISISARASGAVGLCVARRHDGVQYHSRISRARVLSARASVPPTPSTFPRVARRHDGVAGVSRLSCFHLGVCLRRRRSSLASLIVTAATHITRATLALACCRRAPPTPSTFVLPSLRSSPRQRCLRFASLAFSFRRVPQTPSVLLASLVVTAVQNTRASRAPACRQRAPPAPSTFLRFACRHHALPNLVSLTFPSRRVPQAPSVFASLVVTTASNITRPSLALAYCRRVRPHAIGLLSRCSLPRWRCWRLASLAFPYRRVS